MPTETRFDLSITLGNDEMQYPLDVANALRDLAARIEHDDTWYDTNGIVRDINGNTVGRWIVDAYSHDDE